MLKRLFIVWLLVSTLGYSSAWAFDGHYHVVDSHQDVGGEAASATTPDSGDDHAQSGCDHCCHAFAHLLALRSAAPDGRYFRPSADYLPYRQCFHFRFLLPPDRPPIS